MTTKSNLATPASGTLNWDGPLNSNFGIVNTAIGGYISVNAASNYALSASEAQNAMVYVTNASGATRAISLASVSGVWTVWNNSANDLNIYSASGYSGSYVTVRAYQKIDVFSLDGTNMYQSNSDVVRSTGDTMSGTLNLPSNGFTVGSTQLYVSGGNVYTSGQFFSSSNITAYNTSDERLKENIETIPDALDIVKKLRGVTYTMKSDGSPGLGLIAQELQQVLPVLVKEGDDEKLYVAYANLVAVLVNAVKELSEKVEKLESKG